MKHTAFIMAILLTFSLTACSMNGKSNSGNVTNNNPTPSNTGGTVTPGNVNDPKTPIYDKNSEGQDVNIMPGADDDNKTDNSTDAADNNGTDNVGSDKDSVRDRRFMYAGKLYTVTDEKLSQDKVGAELYSISSMLENDEPREDGDAVGLDEGVRIFKLTEENEYRELAVELGGEYYLARVSDAENR